MAQRTDIAHEWTDEQLESLENKLSGAYSQAYKEMAEKHAAFMEEFDKENGAMKGKLKAGEITKDQYSDWLRTRAMTDRWYSENVDYLSKRAVEADKAAMGIINDTLPSVYAENYNWGTYSIESDTSINTAFTLYDEDTIRELMKSDASLLPEAKLNEMKDLRWNKQHFQSAIVQGILQGESIPNMAKRLQSVMQMNLNSATRSARTATTAAENMGRVASYNRAKSMGIDVKKEWLATLDGRTRHSHRQLDGVAIENDEVFDNGCRFPGDPQGPGWESWNCRCTLVANIAGVDQSNAPRNSKLSGMSYEDWKSEQKRKSAPLREPSYTRKVLQDAKVEHVAITRHINQPTMDEIINRVGGGDMTQGSCSSLAFCYIGNRNGFDVLDFRGGKSTSLFARNGVIKDIAHLDGVASYSEKHLNDLKAVDKLIRNMEENKEYLLATGRHVAIVRKSINDEGQPIFEYLELQSSKSNGYKTLDNNALRVRFGCQKSHTIMGTKCEAESILIDSDSLKDNAEFETLLGYINTANDKQKKGQYGSIK